MSLYDIELCLCGHPRHSHKSVWVQDDIDYLSCRNCWCKKFRSQRKADANKTEIDPNRGEADGR